MPANPPEPRMSATHNRRAAPLTDRVRRPYAMALPVHCCCDAHLIGYLTHPNLQQPGDRVAFPVPRDHSTWTPPGDDVRYVPPSETQFELTVDTLTHVRMRLPGDETEEDAVYETTASPDYTRKTWLAIKSRDYPLDWLRSIDGFQEVP